jgi:hypothetical protein
MWLMEVLIYVSAVSGISECCKISNDPGGLKLIANRLKNFSQKIAGKSFSKKFQAKVSANPKIIYFISTKQQSAEEC